MHASFWGHVSKSFPSQWTDLYYPCFIHDCPWLFYSFIYLAILQYLLIYLHECFDHKRLKYENDICFLVKYDCAVFLISVLDTHENFLAVIK